MRYLVSCVCRPQKCTDPGPLCIAFAIEVFDLSLNKNQSGSHDLFSQSEISVYCLMVFAMTSMGKLRRDSARQSVAVSSIGCKYCTFKLELVASNTRMASWTGHIQEGSGSVSFQDV